MLDYLHSTPYRARTNNALCLHVALPVGVISPNQNKFLKTASPLLQFSIWDKPAIPRQHYSELVSGENANENLLDREVSSSLERALSSTRSLIQTCNVYTFYMHTWTHVRAGHTWDLVGSVISYHRYGCLWMKTRDNKIPTTCKTGRKGNPQQSCHNHMNAMFLPALCPDPALGKENGLVTFECWHSSHVTANQS